MIEGYPDGLIFAVIIGVLLLAHATTFIVQQSRRRAEELATVAEASRAHFAALEKLLDDPALSEELKDFISTFHRGVMNREVARRFCRSFFAGEMGRSPRNNAEFSDVDQEMNVLQRTRADLHERLHTLYSTGLVIVFLRWPETAAHFQKAVVEMSVDSRKERAFPRAVIDQDDFHNHNGGGLAAA